MIYDKEGERWYIIYYIEAYLCAMNLSFRNDTKLYN